MFGYRKLLACVSAAGVSTLLLCFHFITGDNWVTFNSFAIGFFLAANAATKFTPPPPSA